MYTTITIMRQSADTLHPERWAEPGQLVIHTGPEGALHLKGGQTITHIDGQPATPDALKPDATFTVKGVVYRVMAFLTPWYD